MFGNRRRWLAGMLALALGLGLAIGRPVSAARDAGTLPTAEVGKPAPDFEFTTLDGRTFRLSEFRGKPVMLWFITTWCPSCTASTRLLGRRIDELAKTDLTIIVLELYRNLGYDGPPLRRFVETNAPNLLDHERVLWGEADFAVSMAYDPQGVTDVYWLIDREGVIHTFESAPSATFGTIRDFAEME